MSDRKVNLEEILTTKFPHLNGYKPWETVEPYIGNHKYIEIGSIYELMKEACRQVLELAAENAKLGYIRTLVDDPKEGDDAYKNFPIVDKESILNIINLIE